MDDAVWITWENQRRNRELSSALRISLHEWKEIDDIGNPVKKYATGITRTSRLLRRKKPKLVFCQNPSLILSSYVVSLKKKAGFKVFVDAHNVGLFPREGKSVALRTLSRYVQRNADLTLVSNDKLGDHVQANRGRPFVLPDRIPDIPKKDPVPLPGRCNILFICSYADDEPYDLVFEAAKSLPEDVCIHVTGNFRKKKVDPAGVPPNISLLGYIPEDQYVGMLNSVDGTIDLTDREDCLVCGAYESVAAEKPQVLSNTPALKKYFHKGAVYTLHSPQSIRNAILELMERKAALERETMELKSEKKVDWEIRKRSLLGLVAEISREGPAAGHGKKSRPPHP